MNTPTFIFQHMPGDKVQIFSPVRKITRTVTRTVFSEMKARSANVNWVEHRPGDVLHEFETGDGQKISFTTQKNHG